MGLASSPLRPPPESCSRPLGSLPLLVVGCQPLFVRVLTESGWKTVGCQRLWDTREVGTRAPVLEAHPLGCLSRVYGSYEHLWAGQVAEALVDLTGGLAERWTLKDLAGTRGQQDGPCGSEPRTCGQLLRLKEHCLISCSVFSPRAGEAWGVRGLVTGPCRDHVGSRASVLPGCCPGVGGDLPQRVLLFPCPGRPPRGRQGAPAGHR